MWGNTPLLVACQYQKQEIAEYLLTMKEVDIHHLNERQASALVFACLEGAEQSLVSIASASPVLSSLGMTSVVRILMEKGVPIDVSPCKIYSSVLDQSIECTPISASILHGHESVVQLFLDYGFPLDYRFSFAILKSFPFTGAKDLMGRITIDNMELIALTDPRCELVAVCLLLWTGQHRQ